MRHRLLRWLVLKIRNNITSTLSAAFTAMMNTPRGQIVNRGALLKEVETDTAALLDLVSDMDDLVAQFDGTEDGLRFIDAWRRARIIVDVGGGQSPPPPPAAPV